MGLGPFSDAKTSQGGVSGHLWRPDQGHGEGPDQRKGGGGGAPQPQDPQQEPPHHGAGGGAALSEDKSHANADGTVY